MSQRRPSARGACRVRVLRPDDGTADVTQKGKRISTLGPGDFFGEIALVSRIPRTATVTTTSPARGARDQCARLPLARRSPPAVALQVLEAVAERLPTAIQQLGPQFGE